MSEILAMIAWDHVEVHTENLRITYYYQDLIYHIDPRCLTVEEGQSVHLVFRLIGFNHSIALYNSFLYNYYLLLKY